MSRDNIILFVLFSLLIEITHGVCPGANVVDCEPGGYFDEIVCRCSRCADICELRPDRSTDASCLTHCPGFLPEVNASKPFTGSKTITVLHSAYNKTTPRTSTTQVSSIVASDDDSLVKKPLFWTSVVSVIISVAAVVTLIFLCTCKKRARNRRLFGRRPRQPIAAGLMRKFEKYDDAKTGASVITTESGSDVSLLPSFLFNLKEERFSNSNQLSSFPGSCHFTGDYCLVRPEAFPASHDLSSPLCRPNVTPLSSCIQNIQLFGPSFGIEIVDHRLVSQVVPRQQNNIQQARPSLKDVNCKRSMLRSFSDSGYIDSPSFSSKMSVGSSYSNDCGTFFELKPNTESNSTTSRQDFSRHVQNVADFDDSCTLLETSLKEPADPSDLKVHVRTGQIPEHEQMHLHVRNSLQIINENVEETALKECSDSFDVDSALLRNGAVECAVIT